MFANYKFSKTISEPLSQTEIGGLGADGNTRQGQQQRLSEQSGHFSAGQSTFGRASDQNSWAKQSYKIRRESNFGQNEEAKRQQSLELPRLPALELFVGFNQQEISYLEDKVLYYLRETLRSFIKEVKKQEQSEQTGLEAPGMRPFNTLHRGSFTGYIFKSDDGQSFGGGEDYTSYMQAQNPFESTAKNDLGSANQRLKDSEVTVKANELRPSSGLSANQTSQEEDGMETTYKAGTFAGRDGPPAKLYSQQVIDPCQLFCETMIQTMQGYKKNIKLFEDRLINKRLSLPQLPSMEYLSTKRKVVFNRNYVSNVDSFAPPKFPKSERDRVQLLMSLEKSFLTQNLTQAALQTIIDAMQLKSYKAGQKIITKGEHGDQYFILKAGKCEVIVSSMTSKAGSTSSSAQASTRMHLKQLKEGDGFGEIALLYNEKRSATIRALSDCEVWVLDGPIFKKIVIKSVQQKRSTELGFLDKVSLFKNLDRFDKLSLLDGLKAQWYNKSEVIVRAGDIGDLFYIIEEGHVECWTKIINAKRKPVERVIRKLTSGDHFGELALINNEKRTLTVKCGSLKAKLLALDRDTFQRILGSIEQYLHLDYSDFCKSFERVDMEEESKRNNLTVNLSGLREDVDSQHVENNNWTHESSHEVNAAIVQAEHEEEQEQQANRSDSCDSGGPVRRHSRNRSLKKHKRITSQFSKPVRGHRTSSDLNDLKDSSPSRSRKSNEITGSHISFNDNTIDAGQLRTYSAYGRVAASRDSSQLVKLESPKNQPFYSTVKAKQSRKMTVQDKRKRSSQRKDQNQPKRRGSDNNSPGEGANALLDSDSDELVQAQIKRAPGPLNTNLTEQAMVSIVTEDDANPLSENGDSSRFYEGQTTVQRPYGAQVQQPHQTLRTFLPRSFKDLKIDNARRLYALSTQKTVGTTHEESKSQRKPSRNQ